MFSFESAWTVADEVEGWLLKSQARALFAAARMVPSSQAVVEIGSHRGKSTIVIASALTEGTKVVAVDPFDDPRWGGGPESFHVFLNNVERAGVRERVEFFRGLSEEASTAWNGCPVGLLWLDGSHDRMTVLKDIDGWLPHMAPGGHMYVHDAFSAIGTTEAVLQRVLPSRRLRYLGSVRTLAMFSVVRPSMASRFLLLARLPFFAQMVAIKIAMRRGWNWALPVLGYDDDAGVI